MPQPSVVVVTDSTASLPAEVAEEHGIVVVPLQVVIGARSFDEGAPEAAPDRLAEALRTFTPVSTSRPAPAILLEAYRRAERAGARQIVSVHLSAEMSGTFEAAQIAARDAGVRVVCVDTRQVGVGTGFAALAAARAAAAGASVEEAAAAAQDRAAATTTFFYVDTLEFLRRGGRIGAAQALLGSALAVKPLLEISDGVVASRERVRTSSKALARLADLAVEASGSGPVDVAVAHLANPERAAGLAEQLTRRLEGRLGDDGVPCSELGAVLGAHVGPGTVAVCVSPHA